LAEKHYKAGLLWIAVFTFFVIVALLLVPTLAGVDDWRFRLLVLGLMLLAGGVGIWKAKRTSHGWANWRLTLCKNDVYYSTKLTLLAPNWCQVAPPSKGAHRCSKSKPKTGRFNARGSIAVSRKLVPAFAQEWRTQEDSNL